MEVSISKEQLAALPPAQFQGTITIIDDPETVESAVSRLRESDLIGFDTETRPSFKKGQSFNVALLQLASDNECFLFRLNKIGMPEPLKALLEDKTLQKVGLSLHDDFRNLHKKYEFEPDGFIELQQYVTQWNITDKSLSKLFGILFGKRISKSQRLSNWEAEQLAESQQNYAALDAQA
ncbi:MAG: 3'-5' exonuclease domain-containing protein 2, partial [Muribaculaceae bacterium]|nr:3'-5' exonuclease domain-containing protein 2 [Muribaculaceae bacterium]